MPIIHDLVARAADLIDYDSYVLHDRGMAGRPRSSSNLAWPSGWRILDVARRPL